MRRRRAIYYVGRIRRFDESLATTTSICGLRMRRGSDMQMRSSGLSRERKCADTIGTVPVPFASDIIFCHCLLSRNVPVIQFDLPSDILKKRAEKFDSALLN